MSEDGYCRQCGGAATLVVPAGDTRPRATCGQCGAVAYDNPKIVVACLLFEGDRMLWMRRGTPPYLGDWTLPAGFAECGETVPEAASREIFEEAHLKVNPEDWTLWGVLSLPDINEVYLPLTAPLPSHDYAPSAEATELQMLNRAEIEEMEFELGYPPPTFPLVLEVYDAIARDELRPAKRRLWEIRGQDPEARP